MTIGRFFIRHEGKAKLAKIVERLPDGVIRYELTKAIEPELAEDAKQSKDGAYP